MVSGVETTTGPLGQGIATSVGMAIAERWLADRYNRPGFEVFDYDTYAICGDGCLMEGVSAEAASLAGHLGLDHLCWIWDNNRIAIEGSTDLTFTEDVAARFLSYGWNVLRVGDANDVERIEHALRVFRATRGRPTFIVLDSSIGYGSPNRQGTAAAHGEPLGDEEIRLTKRVYGWPEAATFLVPDGVREHFAVGMGTRGANAHRAWTQLFGEYRSSYPELATEIDQMQRRELPTDWDRNLPVFPADPKGIAGREASGKVLNVLAQNVPWFFGGSADLGPSNKTTLTFAGAGDLAGRESRRQECALRRARTRDGRDHERAVAVEDAALWRDVLHFQRLCKARDSTLRADGAPDGLRVHARRHGRRRGRANTSARRASGIAARDSRSRHIASWRCQ